MKSNPNNETGRRKKGTKSKKKERQEAEELAEERRLTALLFGSGSSDHDAKATADDELAANQTTQDESSGAFGAIFEIDRTGHEDDDENVAATSREKSSTSQHVKKTKQGDAPVWQDEDDDDDDDAVKVNLLNSSLLRKLRTSKNEAAATALRGSDLEQRLRKRYKSTAQISARTDWAHVSAEDAKQDSDNEKETSHGRTLEKDDDEEEDDDDLKDSAEPLLLRSGSTRLPPNILNTMRCPDANLSEPNQAAVQAVQFHPGSDPDKPLLLTAGFDKTLRFFQVGPETSEKIHGIHFPKLPIYSACFLGTSGNVVVSGRRPFFYLYNAVAGTLDHIPAVGGGREEKSLEKCVASPDGRTIAFVGNDGYVILWDAHCKQWIGNLKLNGSVRAICFSPDGQHIMASGSDGDVYRWDVKSRRCLERFSNQDGTITSSLAASSRHLAVGAESGVVNLYSERRAIRNNNNNRSSALFSLVGDNNTNTPIKSIMNLHTSADLVRFNHDGQILALSSRREKNINSLKLVHVPTATVFANWPTSKTPLNYVWSIDFSPASRFLAVGNDQGKCLLYRLNHYHQD